MGILIVFIHSYNRFNYLERQKQNKLVLKLLSNSSGKCCIRSAEDCSKSASRDNSKSFASISSETAQGIVSGATAEVLRERMHKFSEDYSLQGLPLEFSWDSSKSSSEVLGVICDAPSGVVLGASLEVSSEIPPLKFLWKFLQTFHRGSGGY